VDDRDPLDRPLSAAYRPGIAYDEMYDKEAGVRSHYAALQSRISTLGAGELADRQKTLEQSFLLQGITFTVYGAETSTEQIIPTDLFPRIIPAAEWAKIEAGLAQRLQALNLFLADIYGDQIILKDGVVPRDLVLGAPAYRREMQDLYVPHKAYANVCGSDLIRNEAGEFVVLEDNLRVPSGVSYMLANRDAAKRTFPGTYRTSGVRSIERYPDMLLATLKSLAAEWRLNPQVVVLTPGVYNSAYYEHAYLARLMGAPLVEGRDLVVHDNLVYMRTTVGLKRVDVIYRRVDDDYIDHLTFRRDSALGAAGLFNAYRAGNVVIANAPERALPMTRPSMPMCLRSSATIWIKNRSSPMSTPICAANRSNWATCSTIWISWSLRPSARLEAMACWWGPMPAPKSGQISVSNSRPTPATISLSRPSSYQPRHALWTGQSSHATWTCAPSSSAVTRSSSPPAPSHAWP